MPTARLWRFSALPSLVASFNYTTLPFLPPRIRLPAVADVSFIPLALFLFSSPPASPSRTRARIIRRWWGVQSLLQPGDISPSFPLPNAFFFFFHLVIEALNEGSSSHRTRKFKLIPDFLFHVPPFLPFPV